MSKNQTGFGLIEIALLIVVVGVLGATGWYALNSKHKTDQILDQAAKTSQITPSQSSILSFTACQKAPGSKVLQSFPAVCVSKSGDEYVQPVKYDSSSCNASQIRADSIQAVPTTFVGYDKSADTITYKNSQNGKSIFVTQGWCNTPSVKAKSGSTINLSDLKAGTSIVIEIAWNGIRSIQTQ